MADDLALLEAWRGGDQSAGATLVERHYEAVSRFFRTKAGDDGDDLTQRTFLRCLEATTRYRGATSFAAFLFGIARNVLLEHIRSKSRGKVDPDFGVSSILDLHPRASTAMFQRDEQRRLVAALQRMPVDIQVTLELFYWEELSVEEVAEAVGQAPGTVKSRLHRGRAMLKEALESLSTPDAALVEKALVGGRAAP